MLKLNINNKFLSFVLIPQQLSVSILALSTLSLQAFKHKQQVFKQLLIVQYTYCYLNHSSVVNIAHQRR